MDIFGVRIYRSGLRHIFGPIASAWHDCVFANDFGVSITANGDVEDPLPGLSRTYGSALIAADVGRQLVLIRGSGFDRWAAAVSFCEGAFLPIFGQTPAFDLVEQLYWDREFSLTSESWPPGMRGLLHMWDGAYWQLFTTVRSDVTELVRAHAGDPKSKMFYVDLDSEYPDPSNGELQPATPDGGHGDA